MNLFQSPDERTLTRLVLAAAIAIADVAARGLDSAPLGTTQEQRIAGALAYADAMLAAAERASSSTT